MVDEIPAGDGKIVKLFLQCILAVQDVLNVLETWNVLQSRGVLCFLFHFCCPSSKNDQYCRVSTKVTIYRLRPAMQMDEYDEVWHPCGHKGLTVW
jgi:hypothetical protein